MTFDVEPSSVGAGASVSAQNLYRWWKLDEGAGTVAHDSSPNHADGTLVGGPAWVAGTSGHALEFNGSTQYVDCGTIPALHVNDAFSWSFWVYLLTPHGSLDVIVGDRQGASTPTLEFVKFTETAVEYYMGGPVGTIAYTVPDGQWVHLSLVKDGPNLSYYANGAVVGTSTIAADMGSQPFFIGGDLAAGELAHARVDDVRLYTRALAPTEVRSLAGLGSRIAPAVQVTVRDASGQVLTGYRGPVTISLGANPSGGTLTGTLTVNAVNGVATFPDLALDHAGTGYTLVATASATSGTSTAFDVTAGAASALVFSGEPTDARAGADLSPPVAVSVEDGFGNVVSSSTALATVALATNPGSSTLGGTLGVAAARGVATFPDLTLDKVGTGYTLQATASGLFRAQSTSFAIRDAAPAHLAFSVEPGDGIQGLALATFSVTVTDAFGNLAVSSTTPVSLALGANPGGASLGGTTSVVPVGGVATFTDITLDKTGQGYTLVASSAALGTTSTAFAITGVPTHLAFSVQPATTTAGGTPTGNLYRYWKLDDGAGTVAAEAISGVNATLTGAPAWVPGVSGTALDFDGTSQVATAGTIPALRVQDRFTWSLWVYVKPTASYFNTLAGNRSGGVGYSQCVLTPHNFLYAPNGTPDASLPYLIPRSTWTRVTVVKDGPSLTYYSGVAVVASSTISTDMPSNPFFFGGDPGNDFAPCQLDDIRLYTRALGAAEVAALAQTTPPISPGISVQILDASGSVVTAARQTVSLRIGTNPGGGTLQGTLSHAPVAGVATFTDLWIDRVGAGYTLVASASGLPDQASDPFDVTPGPPAIVAFASSPGTVTAGSPIAPPLTVSIQDVYGNVTPAASGSITVSLGPPPSAATLLGTLTQPVVAGLATFSDLSLDLAATGYTLEAVGPTGLSTGVTAPFTVVAAAPATLAFTTPPVNAVVGVAMSPPPAVTISDRFGNVCTAAASAVSLSLATNPGGANLGGTTGVAPTSGTATFSNVTLDARGKGYSFLASLGGLTTTSALFDVTGPPATLRFMTVPTSVGAGQAPPGRGSTFSVAVEIDDAFGNVVTGSTLPVTIALGTNPGAGTLTGAKTVVPVNGVATFPVLGIDRTGTGYTLAATATSLAGTSTPFDVTPGPATRLSVTTQPAATAAGSPIAPAPAVTLLDFFGNVASTTSSPVAVSVFTGPGGATLSGTLSVTPVGGLATFGGLSLDRTGSYVLAFAASGVPTVESASFAVVPGAPARLAFTVQPSRSRPHQALVPPVAVAVLDALGNVVTNAPNAVSLSLATNPTGANVAGGGPVSPTNGVATFPALALDRDGTGFVLAASASGIATSPTSVPFDLVSDVDFLAAVSLGCSNSTGEVVVGDLNGDGIPDVVYTTTETHSVGIRFGQGQRRYGPEVLIGLLPNGSYPSGLAIVDVNGDGKPDIVVTCSGSNDVAVLIGDGAGNFAAPVFYGTSLRNPQGLVIGDFTGDGKLDLAVAAAWDSAVVVLPGDGTGAFGTPLTFPVGTQPTSIAGGDLDGNGTLDLVVANELSGTISILLGDGKGGFARSDVPVASRTRWVTVGDANGDGKPDLVLVNSFSTTAYVMINTGGGNFSAPASYSLGAGGAAMFVRDVTGDGVPDLVAVCGGANQVQVFRGTGGGAFAAPVAYDAGPGTAGLTFGDVDGDGVLDLLVADGTPLTHGTGPHPGTMTIIPGRGAGAFLEAPQYPIGLASASALAFGDVNGDGYADLVVADLPDHSIAIALGGPGGTFGAPTVIDVGTNAQGVALGDLRGLGRLDIVLTNDSYDHSSVLLNDGTGHFAAPVPVATGYALAPLLVDLDGDGKLDLVVVIQGTYSVAWLKGDGAGGFGAPVSYRVGSTPRCVVAADLDGDGTLDLVVSGTSTDAVSVLLATSPGVFGTATSISVSGGPAWVAVGDVNGDGLPDVVTADLDGTVSVLLGTGGGALGPVVQTSVGFGASCLALRDLDGDGILDVVTSNSGSADVSVLVGRGDGTFYPERRYRVGSGPVALAVGDVNRDGKLDAVVLNQGSATASVLLQR